ncbi:pseudouridine synthase [Thermanaerovibrio acidaminovorans]|jgi:23S rRNA pseudouridine2605 synthase|uniref:pseudouridine synthase n=1 Tax=Thermanaerovibrio acidaminovorans TaxID=81462 RepID=UPI003A5213E6
MRALRLNQYLARCGLGSRRKVEALIVTGRVKLNGLVVSDLGCRVEEGDHVEVDGCSVHPLDKIYIVMNKPRGVVCAVEDRRYRTVLDLLPPQIRALRPFPVGRLDKESQGLLILTNDGDFCDAILHPRRGIIKTYEVTVDRDVPSESLDRLKGGVWSDGEILKPLMVSLMGPRTVRVDIQEGKKREVRRMMAALGFKVLSLLRRRIGKMELRRLRAGGICLFSVDDIWHHINVGGIV